MKGKESGKQRDNLEKKERRGERQSAVAVMAKMRAYWSSIKARACREEDIITMSHK